MVEDALAQTTPAPRALKSVACSPGLDPDGLALHKLGRLCTVLKQQVEGWHPINIAEVRLLNSPMLTTSSPLNFSKNTVLWWKSRTT